MTELDALRGLAAIAVMVYHLRPRAYDFGWSRVDFFLVLSGYLITSVILKYQDSGRFLRVFFIRRALRTWPPYYLALAALIVVNPFLPKPFPMDGLPYYLTFTQNVPYYGADSVPPFNWYFLHTWTLALEEQFYLVWPLLVGLSGRKYLAPLALVVVVLGVGARCLGFHPWLLAARCDGLALGGLLAARMPIQQRTGGRDNQQLALNVMGLVALAYLIGFRIAFGREAFRGPRMIWAGPTILAINLVYVSLVGLIVRYSGHPALGVLRRQELTYLGRISYGIYLFHPLVMLAILAACRPIGIAQTPALEVVMVAACLGVATISWEFLERPILRFKDRFPYQLDARRVEPAMPGKVSVG